MDVLASVGSSGAGFRTVSPSQGFKYSYGSLRCGWRIGAFLSSRIRAETGQHGAVCQRCGWRRNLLLPSREDPHCGGLHWRCRSDEDIPLRLSWTLSDAIPLQGSGYRCTLGCHPHGGFTLLPRSIACRSLARSTTRTRPLSEWLLSVGSAQNRLRSLSLRGGEDIVGALWIRE